MHGRHDNMGRQLVVELLNLLTQIGLHHGDTACLQIRPHLALFRKHRLALHQDLRLPPAEDLVHDALLGILCPMNDDPIGRGIAFKLFQVLREMRERVFFDARGKRP